MDPQTRALRGYNRADRRFEADGVYRPEAEAVRRVAKQRSGANEFQFAPPPMQHGSEMPFMSPGIPQGVDPRALGFSPQQGQSPMNVGGPMDPEMMRRMALENILRQSMEQPAGMPMQRQRTRSNGLEP